MTISENPEKLLKFGKMPELFAYLERLNLEQETQNTIILLQAKWNDMLEQDKKGTIEFSQKQLVKSQVRASLSEIIKEL